ncbi:MAG: tRNA1(Val) (adenine(37)-N6)-methyltransferase [Clostridia bacterium]|nr:tRNA1(Val) (adenine(37)-N6)-methyltransferase [Clostridia bacterium]
MMALETVLREGERIDDLQRSGLRIIQSVRGFRFGTDAVLLADYCAQRVGRQSVDMGTGTGVLPLLIAARNPEVSFEAIELSPAMADMAARSVRMNGLEERIHVQQGDVRGAAEMLGYERMDSVVTNPPYHPEGTGLTSPDKEIAMARGGDNSCPIEAWVHACSRVLKNGGRLFLIYPAARLLTVSQAMQQGRIEPKRIRFVASRTQDAPKLVMIEGIKGGKPGLQIQPVLYTHTADGSYTEEMLRIYGETV